MVSEMVETFDEVRNKARAYTGVSVVFGVFAILIPITSVFGTGSITTILTSIGFLVFSLVFAIAAGINMQKLVGLVK